MIRIMVSVAFLGILTGLALAGNNIWLNVEQQMSTEGGAFTAMSFAIILIGIATAVCFILSGIAKMRQALFLVCIGALGMMMSLTLTTERSSANLEGHRAQIESSNLAPVLAKAKLDGLVKELDQAKKDRRLECVTGKNSSGPGRLCNEAKGVVTTLEAKVAKAQAEVTKAGVSRSANPAAEAIKNATQGAITVKTYNTYRPLLMPFVLEVMGNFLAGLAAAVLGQVSTREEKEKDAPEVPLVVKVQMAYEENPKATVREIAEALGKSPSTISRARQKLQLVKS